MALKINSLTFNLFIDPPSELYLFIFYDMVRESLRALLMSSVVFFRI